MTPTQQLLNFAKDVATNYDHEGRGECYPRCRVCAAESVVGEVLGPEAAAAFLAGPYYRDDAPTDDDVPIDGPWLESQGFVPSGYPHGYRRAYGTTARLTIHAGNGAAEVGHPYHASLYPIDVPICFAPTRGHVRRLLAALGIPTKEAP